MHYLHHPAPGHKDQPGVHQLVQLHETAHNTMEGSEFLDDAIRMEDFPADRTEESIAISNPENIL